MPRIVDVAGVIIGPDAPLALIGGPCVIEGDEMAHRLAEELATLANVLRIPFIFKASFDKANRTRANSFRGPGLERGLEILRSIRARFAIPITTDVHEAGQADRVAEVADLLQVPAFLCRQTDLIVACARTGRPVNLKKGQFLAPWDMRHAVDKALEAGDGGVIVTERGTTFGYNNLVVDMRSMGEIAKLGVPVCFDATHSAQLPGGADGRSGGEREHIPALARAAVAAGADAVFAEIHENPAAALSDPDTQIALGELPRLLASLTTIARAIGR